MDGALVIDKPAGVSSAHVIRQLKRRCKIAKIGHSGTLDPMATGVLVVLCGRATRLQFLFLESSKRYQGTIRLGVRTTTDDITGEEIEKDSALSFRSRFAPEEAVAFLKQQFSGNIEQIPPAVSAIKVDGVRSYRRVRKGEEVELKPRSVVVDIRELYFSAEDTLSYDIHCSKGTYIRSIARDMGDALDTCACLESIRRISSEPFGIEQASNLEEITPENIDSLLIGLEQLVTGVPAVYLSESSCSRLARGDQSQLADLEDLDKIRDFPVAAIFSSDKRLCGLLDNDNGSWSIRMMMTP